MARSRNSSRSSSDSEGGSRGGDGRGLLNFAQQMLAQAKASASSDHRSSGNGQHQGRSPRLSQWFGVNEQSPLLSSFRHGHQDEEGHDRQSDDDNESRAHATGSANPDETPHEADLKTRGIVWGILTIVFVLVLMLVMIFPEAIPEWMLPFMGFLPRDPQAAALVILDRAPVIDGHIDLPILVRELYANNVSAIDLNLEMPGHVDIPRLRKGKVGGFFWSVYVACPENAGKEFVKPTWRVRDTLEQIDVAKLLIAKYPETFELTLGTEDIKTAISRGKIASLLGVEGGHQLGNSLAVLRQYHALGVRYVTLTHTCHNAFADSCGSLPGTIPLHHGLSDFGRTLITEMNRLGVLVDLSHTSDATAIQAIKHSKAPVIWSHSSARAVHDVPRNVPDNVLRLIGSDKEKIDGVVMVNFAPFFVADPGEATVEAVADHVDHIAKVAGKEYVGLGSDFDGIGDTPIGLEDVSKYPALIAELYRRGWSRLELAGLTGGNLLRVFAGAERVAEELQAAGIPPAFDIYDKRPDLPMKNGADEL